ncbi:hypothetical protein D3C83_309440 [compost metagenome]
MISGGHFLICTPFLSRISAIALNWVASPSAITSRVRSPHADSIIARYCSGSAFHLLALM